MFAFEFMQRAYLAGCIVALLCSVLSLFVLLKRMAFVGHGVSHAALGGVALGFLTGTSPLGWAMLFCVGTALGIGTLARKGRLYEDTTIGILSTSAMALGVILIGFSSHYQGDLFGYLFGNILAVGETQLAILAGVAVLVLGFIALFFKELLFISFDEEVAQVTGLPARALYYGLLVAIAATVVATIQVVGLILSSALLVIPAATGYQVAGNWRGILLVAMLSALVAVIGGLTLSYFWDVASGGLIVLLSAGLFFLAFLFSPRRRASAG